MELWGCCAILCLNLYNTAGESSVRMTHRGKIKGKKSGGNNPTFSVNLQSAATWQKRNMRRVELPYPGRFLWKGCRRLSCPVFLYQLQKKQKDGVGYIQKSSLNKLQQFIFSQRDGKQRFQRFHPGDGLRSFLFPRVKPTLPDRLTSPSLSCIVSFVICLLTLCVCLCVYSSGQTKGSERCRGMFTRHLSFALLESRWVSLMVCVCFVWPTVVGANKQRSSRVWVLVLLWLFSCWQASCLRAVCRRICCEC